jgi:YYY domain-containing protein
MHDLVTWYLAVEVLGIVALPTAALAFAHLPDRGWALTKPLGILLVGVLCWLPLVVFPALPFSRGWIVLTLLIFAALNAGAVALRPQLGRDLLAFVRRQWLFVLLDEGIFALTLWVMGSLRALNPQAEGTEKFMDQAFLSSIIRAPHLPPPDPWLSGYPINYYYFGHYLLGMLAKTLGTPAPVAFNIGIALTAALAAAGIFGIAANLTAVILVRAGGLRGGTPLGAVSTARVPSPPESDGTSRLSRATPFALFAVVAALVMGNLRSFWNWWATITATAHAAHESVIAAAWSWLAHPALWSSYDYWNPSRAIPDTITEFPDFSFLLADLHAHVLALPYAVLALGVALHLWLAPPRRGLGIFGAGRRAYVALLAGGLSLGALYLINGWDLPTYLVLALAALGLHQWNAHGRVFSAALWRGIAWAALPLIAICFIPYLPFYLTFVSPGQGIGIVPGTPSHLALTYDNSIYQQTHPGSFPYLPLTRTFIGDAIAANGIMIFILASWLLVLFAQRLAAEFQRQSSRPYRPVTHDVENIAESESDGTEGEIAEAKLMASASRQADRGVDIPVRRPPMPDTIAPAGPRGKQFARDEGDRPATPRGDRIPALEKESPAGLRSSAIAFDRNGRSASHISTGEDGTADIPLHPTVEPTRPFCRIPASVGRLGDRRPAASAAGWSHTPIPSQTDHPLSIEEGNGSRETTAWGWGRAWLLVAGGALALGVVTALTRYWDGWTFVWAALLFTVALWLTVEPFLPNDHPHAAVYGRNSSRPSDLPLSISDGEGAGGWGRATAFPLLLIAVGMGLIAVCEIAFLRDVFVGNLPRMNTVFKAYFQVWLLFALASAPALAWLVTQLPRRLPVGIPRLWRPVAYAGRGIWVLAVVVLVAAALIYPLGASHALYPIGQGVMPSLNGLTDNTQLDPGDIAAIQWLNAHVQGSPVIVEGIDPSNAEYSSTYGRVSVFTGLPAIIGWPGHEYQWRVNWLKDPAHAADYNARLGDLNTIYTSTNPAVVLGLLRHYHARYLYVGPLEWQTYPSSNLNRFRHYFPVVYDTGGVMIYQIPGD